MILLLPFFNFLQNSCFSPANTNVAQTPEPKKTDGKKKNPWPLLLCYPIKGKRFRAAPCNVRGNYKEKKEKSFKFFLVFLQWKRIFSYPNRAFFSAFFRAGDANRKKHYFFAAENAETLKKTQISRAKTTISLKYSVNFTKKQAKRKSFRQFYKNH